MTCKALDGLLRRMRVPTPQPSPTRRFERARYLATPVMSDGSEGPRLELRGLFEQFVLETG